MRLIWAFLPHCPHFIDAKAKESDLSKFIFFNNPNNSIRLCKPLIVNIKLLPKIASAVGSDVKHVVVGVICIPHSELHCRFKDWPSGTIFPRWLICLFPINTHINKLFLRKALSLSVFSGNCPCPSFIYDLKRLPLTKFFLATLGALPPKTSHLNYITLDFLSKSLKSLRPDHRQPWTCSAFSVPRNTEADSWARYPNLSFRNSCECALKTKCQLGLDCKFKGSRKS